MNKICDARSKLAERVDFAMLPAEVDEEAPRPGASAARASRSQRS